MTSGAGERLPLDRGHDEEFTLIRNEHDDEPPDLQCWTAQTYGRLADQLASGPARTGSPRRSARGGRSGTWWRT